MNKVALLLVGLALGQSVPAAAHAQLIDQLVDRVAKEATATSRPAPEPRAAPAPSRGTSSVAVVQRDPPRDERPSDRPPPPATQLVPINQVVNQIQRTTPGKMLDATPADPNSPRPEYRIRWQADSGQRIDFVVDARSGAIVGRKGG